TAEAGGPAALAAAGAAYVGMYAGLAVTSMLCLEMTHRAVTAAERTTVASTSSLALQAGGAMSNVGLGVLATAAGTGVAWVLTAALMAASALLFARIPALRPGGVAAAEPERAASA
ncbi:hypothetical protein, partial [Nonomuraea sp. NPDC005501]|uniref:hypothetical protein n=1 Tax=Nonomuraea sp. NPDC005501 TaxID=3156884 RepID=UPI0033A624A4